MTAYSGAYGSTSISDTGLNSRAPHLNGAHMAPPPTPAKKNKEAGMANGPSDDQDKPGVGHNSASAPSWATPSKLSLDEAAKASIGTGRYAEQRRVLIEAIFDPRLGIAPLPLQLLAAIVECINGGTGLAHPGLRRFAERIVNYLNGIPAPYREGALKNAVTIVRQAGYAVSERRAAERGGRAIAHFAITSPSPEEKEAAIEAWCREKQATEPKPDVTRGMTSHGNVTGGMTSAKVTGGMTSEELRSPVDEGCGHPTGDKNGAIHYTEPEKYNPKIPPTPQKGDGADAPGVGATGEQSQDSKGGQGSKLTSNATGAFERFWEVFPPGRKRDKAGTRDLFVAIVTGKHKKRRASAEVIIAAAKRYADTRPDPQYTPMPSTWLNGGRWEDDECQPKHHAAVSDEEAELAATLERMRAEEEAERRGRS